MSFEIIDSANKRKTLIEKYLRNREVLKERQLNQKIGKQEFQREVATELQKPVVEQAKKVAEKSQEKQDELQNALIQQLQDNQLNNIGQLGLDRNALVQALQALPATQALPAAQALTATQATASSPSITANVDAGIDPGVLQQHSLPLPSHFLGQTKQTTMNARKSVSKSSLFKSLSAKQKKDLPRREKL